MPAPSLTFTREPDPRESDVNTTAPAETVAVTPVSFEFRTCATSAAVADAMLPPIPVKSAAVSATVCAAPPSTATVNVSPSARVNGPVFEPVTAAAVPVWNGDWVDRISAFGPPTSAGRLPLMSIRVVACGGEIAFGGTTIEPPETSWTRNPEPSSMTWPCASNPNVPARV